MRSIDHDASRHVLIDRDDDVYQAYVDVALTTSGKLICVWRETAAHASGNWVRLVMKQSLDLGETWSDRTVLADGSRIDWLLSNIICLKDGRLVINACSTDGQGYLFWSEDCGETWREPKEIDVQGIGPRRLLELHDGTLLQTVEKLLTRKNHWRDALGTAVYQSDDGGASWSFLSVAAESDVLSLCEAPIVQLQDSTLVCYYRENSCLHHPTFKNYSYDNGKTWTEPEATGLYAFQPNATVLKDGRVLFTYCNVGGNSSIYAWCGDGYDSTGPQASARWRNDGCATLTPEGLRIKTTGDCENRPPFYLLLPAETDESTILFEARLKCIENATGDACIVNIIEAGELRFYPDRVDLVHEAIPQDSKTYDWGKDIKVVESFKLEATEFHTYRIVRTPDRTLTVTVDNVQRLKTRKLMRTRSSPFGAAMHDFNCFGTSTHIPGQTHLRAPVVPQKTKGESYWQYVKLRVTNPTLPDYQFDWHVSSGQYPNQYERDYIFEIAYDPNGDPGEPHTMELPDGRIYCVYHTAAKSERGEEVFRNPYIMGCTIHPSDLP